MSITEHTPSPVPTIGQHNAEIEAEIRHNEN
jgi:hypothetical protein